MTEGDFLRRAETGTEPRHSRWLEFVVGPGRLADEYVHSHGRKVGEIMTLEVTTVSEDAALEEVVNIMEHRRIKRLPVISGKKIVGIISRADLVQALGRLAQEVSPTHPDDESARKQIMAELAK